MVTCLVGAMEQLIKSINSLGRIEHCFGFRVLKVISIVSVFAGLVLLHFGSFAFTFLQSTFLSK